MNEFITFKKKWSWIRYDTDELYVWNTGSTQLMTKNISFIFDFDRNLWNSLLKSINVENSNQVWMCNKRVPIHIYHITIVLCHRCRYVLRPTLVSNLFVYEMKKTLLHLITVFGRSFVQLACTLPKKIIGSNLKKQRD